MRKLVILAGAFLLVATLAHAGDATCGTSGCSPLEGFWNSLCGFVNNAMPWNWGNWMGK